MNGDNVLLESVLDMIGPTPIMQLSKLVPSPNPTVFAKLEMLLPGTSSCDRALLAIIMLMEEEGKLREGSVIVLPTDGLAGMGGALIAAQKKLGFIAVMPEDAPETFARLITLQGGEVVRTPAGEKLQGAIARANEIANENPGQRALVNLYEHPLNAEVHRRSTAQEIIKVLGKDIDAAVIGVGTGGTLAGCALALKKVNPRIQIYAVEPAESNVIAGGKPRPHGLHGLGAGFVPAILDQKLIDKCVDVSTEAALEGAKQLAKAEGLIVGPAGGAVIAAMLQIKDEFKADQDIVVILNGVGLPYIDGAFFNPPPPSA